MNNKEKNKRKTSKKNKKNEKKHTLRKFILFIIILCVIIGILLLSFKLYTFQNLAKQMFVNTPSTIVDSNRNCNC